MLGFLYRSSESKTITCTSLLMLLAISTLLSDRENSLFCVKSILMGNRSASRLTTTLSTTTSTATTAVIAVAMLP